MLSRCKKLLGAGLLGGAVLVLLTSELHAQVRVMPHLGNQPSTSTRIGAATANWSQATQGGNRPIFNGGFNRNPGYYGGGVGYGATNPYAYGGGYYGGYMDPGYGYLTGASNVINSQAQYMMSQQQAQQMQEQNKQMQLDTRRKTFEEWRYEQSILPTAEEIRAKNEKADIDRARNNPPSIDIWNATALNTILRDIQKMQSVGMGGPTVLLDPDMLKKIGVTDGTSFGQGQLKDGGKLTWPFALEFDFFEPERKRMDGAMAKAVTQVQGGKRPEFKVIQEMLATEDAMRVTLKEHIHDLTPSQGVEARRYLNDLHETIRTFQDQNVANYVSGKWSARGSNVSELVDNMTKDGLKFAPAGGGNESAYSALYQAMVSYDRMLASLAQR